MKKIVTLITILVFSVQLVAKEGMWIPMLLNNNIAEMQAMGCELSAEDIYKQLITSGEDVGLATVYRVLTQFESAGIVIRHNFEDGHAVYEITPDDHHDHMVCLETGKVIEFHDEVIEKRQESIANEMGYEIVDHSMVLYVKPLK